MNCWYDLVFTIITARDSVTKAIYGANVSVSERSDRYDRKRNTRVRIRRTNIRNRTGLTQMVGVGSLNCSSSSVCEIMK